MKFYKTNNVRAISPPRNAEYPCVVLSRDNWDDYHYRTTYLLTYHPSSKNKESFGQVKILKKNELETEVPGTFRKLSKSYCSLGQSLEYYEKWVNHGEAAYSKVLSALNDVIYNPQVAETFENDEGFTKSLIRFSEAEKAYKEAGQLFPQRGGTVPSKIFAFRFICKVPGADGAHKIDLDFSPDGTKLYRINAFIGKNGTGKTQVLARFANAMSGLEQDVGTFDPKQRPNFSKVIAISYSVFDQFTRPSERRKTFSYKYCGIRKGNELLNSTEIQENLQRALELVELNNRGKQWQKIIGELFNDLVDPRELITEKGKLHLPSYDVLSSGQRILVLVMTEVIANIADESIILFDEPEIHLHPDALAAVARAFHLLLEEFNSYSIIATHSPIILQEIPSKRVRVFKREGSYPIVSRLGIECFGENLTVITDEVFGTTELRNNYREHLEKLAMRYSYDQVLELFDDQLGFNARTFLSTLYEDGAEQIHK